MKGRIQDYLNINYFIHCFIYFYLLQALLLLIGVARCLRLDPNLLMEVRGPYRMLNQPKILK
jgi:hypothetical protein